MTRVDIFPGCQGRIPVYKMYLLRNDTKLCRTMTFVFRSGQWSMNDSESLHRVQLNGVEVSQSAVCTHRFEPTVSTQLTLILSFWSVCGKLFPSERDHRSGFIVWFSLAQRSSSSFEYYWISVCSHAAEGRPHASLLPLSDFQLNKIWSYYYSSMKQGYCGDFNSLPPSLKRWRQKILKGLWVLAAFPRSCKANSPPGEHEAAWCECVWVCVWVLSAID